MAITDYYTILDVQKDPCLDDIKKAFWKPAMDLHPDLPGGCVLCLAQNRQSSEPPGIL